MKRKFFRVSALLFLCAMLISICSFATTRGDVPEPPYDSETVNGIDMQAWSYLSTSCASSELASSGAVSMMSSTTWYEYSTTNGSVKSNYNTVTDYNTSELWCSTYPISGDSVQYAHKSRG